MPGALPKRGLASLKALQRQCLPIPPPLARYNTVVRALRGCHRDPLHQLRDGDIEFERRHSLNSDEFDVGDRCGTVVERVAVMFLNNSVSAISGNS